MKNQYLSEKERSLGKAQMIKYEIFNGISFGFLGDTLAYVLAVRFLASNMVLGYIPTAIYATSLAVPLISRFFEGKNLRSVLYISWILRGFSCFLYLLVLWTHGTIRVVVLILAFTFYMLFRAIGINSYDPIAKSLTTIHSRGRFYSTLNYAYNLSMLAAKVVASVVTYFYDSILSIVILQMVGIVGNTIASVHAKKIPCRLVYSKSSEIKLCSIFLTIFKNAKIWNRVFLKWIYYMVTVIIGMSIPFMSVKAGLSDGLVILYSVTISMAYISAGMVSRFLSDSTGAKPILVISSSLSAVFVGLFLISSVSSPIFMFFIIGFMMNFFVQLSVIQSNQLVVSILPDKNAAGFNMAVNLGAGIAAIFAGFFSGWLVTRGELHPFLSSFVLLNDYSLCFLFGLLCCFAGIAMAVSLKERNAKKTLDLISLRNLHAISQLSAIENSMSSFYRRKHIMDLGENQTAFVYGEVKRKLLSPYSGETHDLLKVIGEKNLKSYSLECIRIAEDDDNYMQITAIETLSNFKDDDKVRIGLEKVFKSSKWLSARSAAAKALSRFKGMERLLPDVLELARNAIHIEMCVDCTIAAFHMDEQKRVFEDVFSKWSLERSETFRQTRYSCFDALLFEGHSVSRLARLYENINGANRTYEISSDMVSEEKKYAYEAFFEDFKNIDYIDSHCSELVLGMSKGFDGGNSVFLAHICGICGGLMKMKGQGGGNDMSLKCKRLLTGVEKAKDDGNLENMDETDRIALMYFAVYIRNQAEESAQR